MRRNLVGKTGDQVGELRRPGDQSQMAGARQHHVAGLRQPSEITARQLRRHDTIQAVFSRDDRTGRSIDDGSLKR
jgi:hypothetical protein